jgi:hypothetical protein
MRGLLSADGAAEFSIGTAELNVEFRFLFTTLARVDVERLSFHFSTSMVF